MLEFENVCKSFVSTDSDTKAKSNARSVALSENPKSALSVIKNLSFRVNQGEFFSFLGPSGCGKTTCLRMISGLERPTSGIVRINGQVMNHVHPHKRNVHMVFQKYALFPHLNVFENVAFGLRMKKLPSHEIKKKVERMLTMVHLQHYATRSIQKLSGGEQQRIALVRALVNEPAILLLDEPLGALDLKLREAMQQELVAIQKATRTTFIFVTHDQSEALTLSDRVAIMNRGRIEQIGTPTEVYENPATGFVARFVGTTNTFQGHIAERDSSVARIDTMAYGQLLAKIPESSITDQCEIVVRPEKIRIRSTPPDSSSATNSFRGVLLERTYFGATTQIKLQVKEGAPPLLALVTNQSSQKMPQLKIGERYYAVWDASDSTIVQTENPTTNEILT